MVAGYVGCGKTTLAAKVLGNDIVPEDAIGHSESTTKGFIEYGDEYINIIDSQGFEPPMTQENFLQFIQARIRAKQINDDIKEHIHLVWYCIEGSKARVTPTDIDLINNILPKESTILVLTKMDITKPAQKQALTEKLLESTHISAERILYVAEDDKESLERLVEISNKILPDAYRQAFMSKQKVLLENKRTRANNCITNYALGLGLVGIIPLFDLPIIISQQYRMIGDIAQIYGFNAQEVKSLVGVSGVATAAGTIAGGSLLDLAGPVGWVAGGFSAGVITGGLGLIVSDYFYRCSEAIMAGKNIEEISKFNFDESEFKIAIEMFKSMFLK